MTDANLRRLVTLVAAVRAYDRAHSTNQCGDCGGEVDGDGCSSCEARRRADVEHLLAPPARIGYGHATDDDLRRLGIDRHAERDAQLRTWIGDLRSAVEVGLITKHEKNTAMRRAQAAERRGRSTTA